VASVGGNILSLTRAADSEAKVIGMLADRLGIDSTEANETLKFHSGLLSALVAAVRKSPSIGYGIADAYRSAKRYDEADALERLAITSEEKLKEREAIS
jgi:hypothetical protein